MQLSRKHPSLQSIPKGVFGKRYSTVAEGITVSIPIPGEQAKAYSTCAAES